MKIYREMDLSEFEFWSGARSTVELLTKEELYLIQEYLEEECEPMSETEVNDFFWFDTEWLAIFLGYEDFESLYCERRYR